jgi:hypothetical protein
MSIHNRISGPVSIYYLKPNNNSLPLFLLFGDIHGSYENMCSECTCEDAKNCCHAIYDKAFLKKIEKLAKPNRPIDFYTEYFEDSYTQFKGPLEKFLEPEFQACYKRTLKNKKNCPAPKIRWHYSDIRFADTKNNIETIFNSLFGFTDFCVELNKTNSYKGVPLDSWLKLDKTMLIEHIIPGVNISKTEELHKIIDLLAEFPHLTIDKFAERIIDFLFESKKYPSLIHKQFKKQVKNSMFADKSYIVKMMRDSLERWNLKYNIDSKLFEQLKNFDITGDYTNISNYLLINNAIFVDIYIILRTMKNIPSPPSLCITYLGDNHIRNMVNMLLDTGIYKLIAAGHENEENRCLQFDHVLEDLRSSLKKRNLSQKTTSKHKPFSLKKLSFILF